MKSRRGELCIEKYEWIKNHSPIHTNDQLEQLVEEINSSHENDENLDYLWTLKYIYIPLPDNSMKWSTVRFICERFSTLVEKAMN